jgi:hypothetical protein
VDGFRLLNPEDARDVALIERLLMAREPVSEVVGVVNEQAVFCFNEGRRPLCYAEDLDVIVCLERVGTELKLFDVVGVKIPPLVALLERLPGPVGEVTIHFAPDRLGVEAKAVPYVLDHDYLMVRGPFPAEGEAFALPRSART